MKKPTFIFVTGHVLSGVGKGTIASSLALLLKAHNFKVTAAKIDPYLNMDSGTMSPYEHGECYVLKDGMECDLDLGNYERFLDINLESRNSITTGQIYSAVLQKERNGEYLGKTIQVIPHITDHIRERILNVADTQQDLDFVIVELGGTVGDIESLPFLHTLSHFENQTGCPVCFVSVGLVVNNNGELKTKPLQRSIQDLNQYGISPDILILRCDIDSNYFPPELKNKVSNSCNVSVDSIVISGKVDSIYEVPKLLYEQYLPEMICKKVGMPWRSCIPNWNGYNDILEWLNKKDQLPIIRVAIIAKYVGHADTYLSLTRALEHAAINLNLNVIYDILDAEDLPSLKNYDRILVPGGFGERGINEKMAAINKARKFKIPFLGICLGMQLFVINHCRSVLGWRDAHSTEFSLDTTHPVVDHLSSYGSTITDKFGGTMRLGDQKMIITQNSLLFKYYNADRAVERHRHRYEISQWFVDNYPHSGLLISAISDNDLNIPEIVENWPGSSGGIDDWWAVGCQFHPEFTSRNNNPHPIFTAFLQANTHIPQRQP